MIIKILYVLAAYLCGAIPFAYIFSKLFAGVDIRTVGSGNPGATNVFRAVGKKAGIITFIFDALKGFLPVFFAACIDPSFYYALIIAFAAMLGHMFTVFLRFKGGKGIATGLGIFLALIPVPALIALAVFIIVLLLTGYVAVASILATIAIPVIALILNYSWEAIIFSLIMAIIVIYKHRSNIKRLINGTEHKFNILRKGK